MLHKILRIILWNYMVLCNGAIIPVHRQGKLSLVEWTNYNYREPEGYGTYAFGYDVEDPETNNIQFRNEEKLSNGSVIGSYGYLEESGNAFVVNYIADHNGYRAFVEDSTKLKSLKPSFLTPLRKRTVENTSGYMQMRTGNEKTEEPFDNTSLKNKTHIHLHIKNSESSSTNSNSHFEMSKNAMKEMNPTRKKYRDSNFNKEKEGNTKNLSKTPNFHEKNYERVYRRIVN
ncbi:hypothetical protein WA026_003422 [Henosepilachna vigintioctopunctata]|uniref:Uncharacterized protein n=1 Tax=Henosepilachna vigintioctopunctata TaxID=420089 RepID=A0AAW1TMT4_9CUCU